MIIEIVNKEGLLITNFDLQSNPFKVGEKINIKIRNYDKSFWTAEDFKGDFVIEEIQHFFKKSYTWSQKQHEDFIVSVQVSPL